MPIKADDVDAGDLGEGFQGAPPNHDPLDDVCFSDGPPLTQQYKDDETCIRTGCLNPRVWRGMCPNCGGYELGRVRKGLVTWEMLVLVSRALPDERPAPVVVLRASNPYECIAPACHAAPRGSGLCDTHDRHVRRLIERRDLDSPEALDVVLGRVEGCDVEDD